MMVVIEGSFVVQTCATGTGRQRQIILGRVGRGGTRRWSTRNKSGEGADLVHLKVADGGW